MEYTLKNKKLTVVFESKGATLHSIKDNDGVEYLWEGNPEYWSGQAPVLFPICGSIRDDKAQIGNRKQTNMPRHGVVRKKEFKCVEQTENSILFEIESNEEMLAQYPYEFKLGINYILEGKKITTRYIIENKDKVFCEFLEKERKRMERVIDALKRNGMSETEIGKQKISSEYNLLRQTLLRMH